LKFCVLNINMSLQFADTIILNICSQFVRGYSTLALMYAIDVFKNMDTTTFENRPTLEN